MKTKRPVVDYRELRLSNLNTDRFRHLNLLFYWLLFGLMFFLLERVVPVDSYYPMYCRWDNYIPFNELFVFPYMFWFVFLIGIHGYTLLYDIEAFRKLMKYIILTYSAALIVFILFPNCQQLRPAEFERDNILTQFMAAFYKFDTNTNVCPSLHVIGSVAVLTSAVNIKRFQTPTWMTFFIISTILISISTIFLKQHSVTDIIAALPICFLAYFPCYVAVPRKRSAKKEGLYESN
ncbi:MAG: phosphatase PAP2 family protein [Clostridia bacterium]|nr:phosphatase PAP2 family protein [Clostridia bacterium]